MIRSGAPSGGPKHEARPGALDQLHPSFLEPNDIKTEPNWIPKSIQNPVSKVISKMETNQWQKEPTITSTVIHLEWEWESINVHEIVVIFTRKRKNGVQTEPKLCQKHIKAQMPKVRAKMMAKWIPSAMR